MAEVTEYMRGTGGLDESYGEDGVVDIESEFRFGDFDKNLLWLDDQDRAIFMFTVSRPEVTGGIPVIRRLLAQGSVDLEFGTEGEVVLGREIIPAATIHYNLHRRPNGRLLTVCSAEGRGGAFILYAVQLLPDGALDPTFGNAGVSEVGEYSDPIRSISVQTDGKVLLAGANAGYGMVIRLTETGSLDNAWGNQGVQLHHFEKDGLVFHQVSQSSADDDRVIVLGYDAYMPNGEAINFVIARLLPAGSLDLDFGSGGVIREEFPTTSDGVRWAQFIPQQDKKLLVFLSIRQGAIKSLGWQGRYTQDGVFDPEFHSGRPWHDFFNPAAITGFEKALQLTDGRIVMCGTYSVNGKHSLGCIRYLLPPQGRDTSFGENGIISIDAADVFFVQGLAVQSDGKYLTLSYDRPTTRLLRLLP